MRRSLSLLAATAVALIAVACTDAVSPREGAGGLRPDGAASRWSYTGYRMVISPGASEATVGAYTLRWSANAVACVGTPCVPWEGGPLKLDVRTHSENGAYWVDFYPHVEFKPTATVTLSSRAYASQILALVAGGVLPTSDVWQSYYIRYANFIGDAGILDRPSTIDFLTGTVTRRVDHFSGYVITAGGTCNPQTDSNCPGGGGEGGAQ